MRRGWVVTFALLASSLLTLAAAQAPPAPAPTAHAEYVGNEACKDCHEKEYTAYTASAHGRVNGDASALPSKLDCETCHGPGSLHVKADNDKSDPGFATMRVFSKLPAAEANATCLSCHNGGEQFYWAHSSHARHDVACVQCHSMHDPQDPGHAKLLKTETVTETCVGCHKTKQFQLSKSAHMPLREGSMDCASCHNPHGTATPHQIRATTVNELCTGCHADKRGPMLWEHAPVRENCLNCHEPHGANNDKVLTAKRPYLCQRCHIGTRHPATLYDFPDLASNRLFNRSCQNCHSQIHGSNDPSGKFFLR